METKNVMIVGVGGQGSLLASKLLGRLLLGKGYDINEIFVLKPSLFRQFAFDCSNHRDAATDGEGSDFGKNKKYFPE